MDCCKEGDCSDLVSFPKRTKKREREREKEMAQVPRLPTLPGMTREEAQREINMELEECKKRYRRAAEEYLEVLNTMTVTLYEDALKRLDEAAERISTSRSSGGSSSDFREKEGKPVSGK